MAYRKLSDKELGTIIGGTNYFTMICNNVEAAWHHMCQSFYSGCKASPFK